uniref:GIY-YIG nuclease family protein n=1 Tax=Sphingomonas sp. TaxID=28214 RepID=UPI0025D2F76B|nr:GIY-YIG nuclease family protein [Sphingomonas sp.]
MAFWAYILRCGDGSYYAGHCDDLDQRIGMHQAGRGSDYTARRQPVTIIWSQDFSSRIYALEAERQIKGWSRAKKDALVAGDWGRISQLVKSRGTHPSTSSGRTVLGERAGIKDPVRDEPVEAPSRQAAQ